MSKAVLVMDMPSGCFECPIGQNEILPFESCVQCPLGKCVVDSEMETRPDWCPLKPMPEKKDICGTYNSEYYANGGMMPSAKIGYNACIDELLGYNPYQE